MSNSPRDLIDCSDKSGQSTDNLRAEGVLYPMRAHSDWTKNQPITTNPSNPFPQP